MLEIKARLSAAEERRIDAQISMSYAKRAKGRISTALASGEPVEISLPEGEIVRGGDRLLAADGRVVQVLAEAEGLLQAEAPSPAVLAVAAYQLGDSHVPVEIGADYLRVQQGRGLEDGLKKLGVRLRRLIAPFEPETQPGPHHHGDAHGHQHV